MTMQKKMPSYASTDEKHALIIPVLHHSGLFRGINDKEAEAIMPCINAHLTSYGAGDSIARRGDTLTAIGMVIYGSVQIVDEDFWGNRNIISRIDVGDIFAESYACVPNSQLRENVIASEPSIILYMDIRKMIHTCTNACAFHQRLSQNMIVQIARKNLMLTEKIEQTSKRTTRDKLLAYLSAQAYKQGTPSFDIPFNRQQLADYLSVDRSAMSNELSKLRDEHIIEYNRNHFALKMN